MISRETVSHICPGPYLGYRNCSMSEVSVPFWAMSPRRRKSLPKMCFKVPRIDRPLTRCAPHSALIAEQRSPQTFSV